MDITLLSITITGGLYLIQILVCIWLHAKNDTRDPKGVWDFIKLTFLPYILIKGLKNLKNNIMKNQVIKVLNKEHSKKVIQYWKNKGIDTRGFVGLSTEEDGNVYIYYGIINNKFNNYNINHVKENNAEIITLPINTFPRQVMVSNNGDCWAKHTLVAEILNHKYPFIALHSSEPKEDRFTGWKYMKEIEPVKEMTLEQVCKELGRDIKIIK